MFGMRIRGQETMSETMSGGKQGEGDKDIAPGAVLKCTRPEMAKMVPVTDFRSHWRMRCSIVLWSFQSTMQSYEEQCVANASISGVHSTCSYGSLRKHLAPAPCMAAIPSRT